MINFQHRVNIPSSVLEKTISFLQQYGKAGLESHALWIGKKNSNTFHVEEVLFPNQHNTSISFEVSGEEIHRINVEIHNAKKSIIAQVHTHPSEAYHSCVDDEGAYLTLPNSLSIVFPNYGFFNFTELTNWQIYFFDGTEWKHLDHMEVLELFKIM